MSAYRLDIQSDIGLPELAARAIAWSADPNEPSLSWLRCDNGELVAVTTEEMSYDFMFECSTLRLRRHGWPTAAAPRTEDFVPLPWQGAATVQTVLAPEFLEPAAESRNADALTLIQEGVPLWRVPSEVSSWCLVTTGFVLTGPRGDRLLVSTDPMPTWIVMTMDPREIADRTVGALLLAHK